MSAVSAVLWIVLAASPLPAAKVLVLTHPGQTMRPAQLETLRIQLSDLAVVEERQELATGLLVDRVAQAAALVESTGATLAIWIETSTQVDELVLYAASRHRERALVQVIRVHAGGGLRSTAELDRVVALKIGELVDAALTSATALQPQDAPTPALTRIPTPGHQARSFGLLLELGVAASGSGAAEAHLATALAGGGWRRAGALTTEAYLALRQFGDVQVSRSVGRVVLDETDVAAGLRARGQGRRLGAGLYAEAGARLIAALGVASDGRTGEASRTVPTLSAGIDVRLALAPWLALRGALGVEGALVRDQFAVDDVTVIERGRLRLLGQLSLVVSGP